MSNSGVPPELPQQGAKTTPGAKTEFPGAKTQLPGAKEQIPSAGRRQERRIGAGYSKVHAPSSILAPCETLGEKLDREEDARGRQAAAVSGGGAVRAREGRTGMGRADWMK